MAVPITGLRSRTWRVSRPFRIARFEFEFAEGVATRDLISEVGQMPVLPEHYYQTVDFTRSTLEPPLGSGPYLVDRVDAGRQIVYCRNPGYWAVALPVNVGANNFDCFRYEYFADNTAAFEALKAGVYLFHEEFFSALWATAYDFPALEKGWVKREVLDDGRPSGAQGVLVQHAASQVPGPESARGHRDDVQLRVVERDAFLRIPTHGSTASGRMRRCRRKAC